MATAVQKLTQTKALGNIRPLATQTRSKSAPAAEGMAQAQDQIDRLLALTQSAVSELAVTTTSDDAGVTINDVVVVY